MSRPDSNLRFSCLSLPEYWIHTHEPSYLALFKQSSRTEKERIQKQPDRPPSPAHDTGLSSWGSWMCGPFATPTALQVGSTHQDPMGVPWKGYSGAHWVTLSQTSVPQQSGAVPRFVCKWHHVDTSVSTPSPGTPVTAQGPHQVLDSSRDPTVTEVGRETEAQSRQGADSLRGFLEEEDPNELRQDCAGVCGLERVPSSAMRRRPRGLLGPLQRLTACHTGHAVTPVGHTGTP